MSAGRSRACSSSRRVSDSASEPRHIRQVVSSPFAGALLITARFATDVDAAHVGVAAMAVLTAAIATYPRFTWDLASALTLAGVLLGTPLLARQLERADGLSVGDIAWIAFALATVGIEPSVVATGNHTRQRHGVPCCGC